MKRLRLIADDGMGLPMKMPALENALPILERIASVEVRDDALREPLWTNAAPPASHSHRFRRPRADE
ncbi:MAG: hypothetical protein Q8N26_35050 [Myxococcales bacterium]|nr:hypothetical protein [Myxococcales bacterium]